MPLDRPRPPIQRPDGARRRLTLSRAHSEGLRSLAQSESMTLFIAGLALLKALLVRWTNQEKLAVATPYDYRQGPELEPLMGFFINQLVLYTDLAGNPTFREVLARVRETALGAYDHHDLPFVKLAEALQPGRGLSYIPYSQVVFLLLPLPAHATPGVAQGRADVDEIAMDGFWVDARRTQFDVNFALWEEEDGRLAGFIEHSTALFDAATIHRLRELFRNLLAAVLDEPDRRLWDVPLLSEAQTHQLVRERNPRQERGEAYVLDPAGLPAPLGVTGELCVGADTMPFDDLGHFADPVLAAERFIPDAYGRHPGGRLFRSGKLARWRGAAGVGIELEPLRSPFPFMIPE